MRLDILLASKMSHNAKQCLHIEISITTANMLLPQAALVLLPTPVDAMNISSRNKIAKGDVRQTEDR
jgi:hypothetical protein